MTAHLVVRAPGLHTTVQDLGRFGYLSAGVPVSGALDGVSLRLANHLVGNAPEAAGLEILIHGPTLEADADSVRLAYVGPDAGLEILDPTPRPVAPNRSFLLRRGETLRMGALGDGFAGYLAVEGGLDLAPCLGSLATYVRAAIGGFEGRALAPGDRVPLVLPEGSEGPDLALPRAVDAAKEQPVRLVLGPQDDHFTRGAIETLLGEPYRISTDADRMGFRLDGPALAHRDGYDIVSDGIATGAIQVPGSGQPILLLADHQSTGGYPKVATVILADVPRLARRRPGDEIRFAAVTVEEAEAIFDADAAGIAKLAGNLEPARDVAGPSLELLYRANLISGVVDANDDSV